MARPSPPQPPQNLRRHNVRLVVEYDGTRYSGFQIQPTARTVAGELTAAVRDAIAEPTALIGAGRTDAGVHAEGQVVNFLARVRPDPATLREQLNDRLPPDINVLRVDLVDSDFHSRSAAAARVYRYQISLRRDAFRKRAVWWVRSPLDEARLVAEAAVIPGRHDFASFTDATDEGTEITVHDAAWRREGDLLLFHIRAQRFLYRMVRRLVGAMVECGLGREPAGHVRRLLAEPRPGAVAATTAPPSGLFLERVEYPEAAGVTARGARGGSGRSGRRGRGSV